MSTTLEKLATRAQKDRLVKKPVPLPTGDDLHFPDGTPAHKDLRAWASFDRFVHVFVAGSPVDLEFVDPDGQILADTITDVLKDTMIEDQRDELDEDEETLEYLEERVEELSEEFPGWAIRLDRDTTPDHILWFPVDEPPRVLVLKHDDVHKNTSLADAMEKRLLEK